MDINLLITGTPRNVYDFFLALSYMKKADITIKRVVFSTWENIDQATFDILASHGIEIVTQPLARDAGIGNIYHQYRSFMYGLSFFERSDYVLKMRTDLNTGLAEIIKMFKADINSGLKNQDNFLSQFSNQYFNVFSEYVYANRASLIYPGRIQDVVFLGRQDDLTRLAHYSSYFFNIKKEILDAEYGPEYTWFGHAFATQFPTIQYLYNLVDIRKFSAMVRELMNNDLNDKALDFVSKYFAYNFMIIFNNIRLPDRLSTSHSSLESCWLKYKDDVAFWEKIHKYYDFRVINQNVYKSLFTSNRVFDKKIFEYMKKFSQIKSEDEFISNERDLVSSLEKFCIDIENKSNISILKEKQKKFDGFEWVKIENFPILRKTIKSKDKVYIKFFFDFCANKGIVSLESAVIRFFVENIDNFIQEGSLSVYLDIFESYELISKRTLHKITTNLSIDIQTHLTEISFDTIDRELRIRD